MTATELVITDDQLRLELVHEETQIENGLYQAGMALQRIRDERLYRLDYADFDTYCRERWRQSASHVNRKIGAGRVLDVIREVVSDESQLPGRESHLRALTGMNSEDIKIVWRVIRDCFPDEKLTATKINSVVEVFKTAVVTGHVEYPDSDIPAMDSQISVKDGIPRIFQAAILKDLLERIERMRGHINERKTATVDNDHQWSKEQTGLIRCIDGKWYMMLENGLPEFSEQEISYKLKLPKKEDK